MVVKHSLRGTTFAIEISGKVKTTAADGSVSVSLREVVETCSLTVAP
jgi:hypothetical protein